MIKTILRSWKRALAFFFVILLAGGFGPRAPQATAQTAASSGFTIKWIRSFGNFYGLTPEMTAAGYSEEDRCADAVETGDGGLVLVGTATLTLPSEDSAMDLIVMEVRPSGEVDWALAYECPPGEGTLYSGVGIARCQDGDYLVTGRSDHLKYTDPNYAHHPVLLKVSPGGGLRWIRLLGVGGADPGRNDDSEVLRPTSDGGFLLSGFTGDIGNWIMKLDQAGKVLWCRSYSPGLSNPHPTADGGFIATGWDSIPLVAKCDASGRIQWRKAYTQEPWDCGDIESFISDAWPTADGGFLLIGETSGCGCCRQQGLVNDWVCKLDASGRILWKKGARAAQEVFQTLDGGFVLSNDDSLSKFSASGSFLWTRTVVDTWINRAFRSSDGGFVASGRLYPSDSLHTVMTVLRLDSSGKIGPCARITSSLLSQGGTGIHAVSALPFSVHSNLVWMKSLPRTIVNRNCEVKTLCTSMSMRPLPLRAQTTNARRS